MILNISEESSLKRTIIVIIVFIFLICLSYFYINYNNDGTKKNLDDIPKKTAYESKELHYESSLANNPKPVQDMFLLKVKNNINDDVTKMSAYWVAHRYFDNGGDMTEIYDFVNAHEELSFLKEAEGIYPEIFKKFKEGNVKKNSYDSLYLFLAYLEVIEKYGYADIASLGTLSASYAQLAHYNKNNTGTSSQLGGTNGSAFILTKDKSVKYFNLLYPDIDKLVDENMSGTFFNNIDVRDIVVGLNKYIIVTSYYDNLDIDYQSISKRDIVFEHAKSLSKKHIYNLYSTSMHDYAISLVLSGEINNKEDVYMCELLMPVTEPGNRNGSLLLRVVRKEGVFGRDITSKLASRCFPFKKWLIFNSKGNWKESDFVIAK